MSRAIGRSLRAGSLVMLLVLAALCVGFSQAQASWPNNPYQAISLGTGRPYSLVSDGAGGMLSLKLVNNSLVLSHILQHGDLDTSWPVGGTPIGAASTGLPVISDVPALVSDGAGGAFVMWGLSPTGNLSASRVRVQHVMANGSIAPGWPVGGVQVDTTSAGQTQAVIAGDGAGGAYVVWKRTQVWVQHVLASGIDPAWPRIGLPVTATAFTQGTPQVLTTQPGSALVVWFDSRNSPANRLYAQRVLSSPPQRDAAFTPDGLLLDEAQFLAVPTLTPSSNGDVIAVWRHDDLSAARIRAQRFTQQAAISWPPGGVEVASAISAAPAGVVSDGAGGVLVQARLDELGAGTPRTMVHHVLSNGVLDAGWPAGGVTLALPTADESAHVIASDGSGGAYVACVRVYQSAPLEAAVTVQQIAADGTMPSGVPIPGLRLGASGEVHSQPVLAADGSRGVVVAWTETATGGPARAQRLAPYLRVGEPQAGAMRAVDVPNDQGKRIALSWAASPIESELTSQTVFYDVYFSTVGPPSYNWQLFTNVIGVKLANYGQTVVTLSDSSASGSARVWFKVATRVASRSWDSDIVSASSIDNLTPPPPTQLAGTYDGARVALSWTASEAPDVAGYRVYHLREGELTPSPADRVAEVATTSYEGVGEPGWYAIAAVDASGNESPAVTLLPAATAGAGSAPRALSFARPTPSPATTSSVLRFGLPSAQHVRLTVLDVSGRLVRTLADGEFAAGEVSRTWDLRDVSGARVGAGLYFARLETAQGRIVRRMEVMR